MKEKIPEENAGGECMYIVQNFSASVFSFRSSKHGKTMLEAQSFRR